MIIKVIFFFDDVIISNWSKSMKSIIKVVGNDSIFCRFYHESYETCDVCLLANGSRPRKVFD